MAAVRFSRRPSVGPALLLGVFLLLALLLAPALRTRPSATSTAPTGLHVSGNQMVDGDGRPLRLLGVNRSGAEFACVQGWGIFDGPADAASVQAITGWRINAVRVPLNESCWLGINGTPAAHSGANYQAAIVNYVTLLNQHGLVVILDLHWAAPDDTPATGLQPMPNRDHSTTFWAQVATTFKSNSSAIFDLFNEPYPDNNRDTEDAWRCWRDGGACPGVPYQAAGMQELVNAVRDTGAENVILLGGVAYGAHLSRWLAYQPSDPAGNLAASWHVYDFSRCNSRDCWDAEIAPLARQVPVVVGEIGEGDCAHRFIDPLMRWLDARGIGYLAWTWNTWDCAGGPALISSYDGTPTAYGRGFRDHLAELAAQSPTPNSN
ncbi:MAG: glycoside hydrolase family 5 protein [Dehalococcoidia bacterium]